MSGSQVRSIVAFIDTNKGKYKTKFLKVNINYNKLFKINNFIIYFYQSFKINIF